MYNTIKSNRRFPKLSKVLPGKRKPKPETPDSLRKLLLPKEELELEEVSLSGSEVSDAFADLHTQSFLSHAKNEKPISKQEADRLTMAQFTDNFKETIADARKELQLGENMMRESMEDIQHILNEQREGEKLPESVQERIAEMLKDREYLCSTPSQASDDAEAARKGSNVTFDAMSGIWRMLAVDDTKENFRVSSPNFNAFQQEEPHWLERPPIPWQTLDFSKHKCEKWLSEQHD